MDTDVQLARLRQRISAIDLKYAVRPRPAARLYAPAIAPLHTARFFIEEWSEGQVVSNESGLHFQMERLYPSHRPHGNADVGALSELTHDFFDAISGGEIPLTAPERLAFLDTETTGLAGGSGTYAFLIGVGRITSEGFRVRQFFMREYGEESSTLAALEAHLNEFDVLVTYNGRSYDLPLLETRYRMNRRRAPFDRLPHLDLLHGTRRLWKLRFDNCRLVQLEQQILGVERQGDLPGELIPYVYFEYLRSHEASRLIPIFHHNAMDILTLACLSAIVPAAFRSTDLESLEKLGIHRGEELASLARWLLTGGELERGLTLLERAVDAGLPDALLFRTLWDIALLEKKLSHTDAALRLFTELAGCRNDFRARALEELAKHYEHEERNYTMALEFTKQGLAYDASNSLERRRERLERRLSRPRSRRLLS